MQCGLSTLGWTKPGGSSATRCTTPSSALPPPRCPSTPSLSAQRGLGEWTSCRRGGGQWQPLNANNARSPPGPPTLSKPLPPNRPTDCSTCYICAQARTAWCLHRRRRVRRVVVAPGHLRAGSGRPPHAETAPAEPDRHRSGRSGFDTTTCPRYWIKPRPAATFEWRRVVCVLGGGRGGAARSVRCGRHASGDTLHAWFRLRTHPTAMPRRTRRV